MGEEGESVIITRTYKHARCKSLKVERGDALGFKAHARNTQYS